MAEFDGDKSQEATPHRRQQAREEGHVAKSQDLASASLLVLGIATLILFGGALADYLIDYGRQQLGGEAWLSIDAGQASFLWNKTFFGMAPRLLPLFGLLFAAAVAVNLAQVGFLFLPDKLAPDFTRIDPVQGFQRVFSLPSVMRLAFALLKLAIVAAVAGVSLYNQREAILGLSRMAVGQIALFMAQILLWTALKVGAALLVLAILDYGFQRWKYDRDLRMTPQEMREELKNLEGNPLVIARRRQVQRQLAMHRLSDAVPKANVVVTNPTKLAVAIQYEIGDHGRPDRDRQGGGSDRRADPPIGLAERHSRRGAEAAGAGPVPSRQRPASDSAGQVRRRGRSARLRVSAQGKEDRPAGVTAALARLLGTSARNAVEQLTDHPRIEFLKGGIHSNIVLPDRKGIYWEAFMAKPLDVTADRQRSILTFEEFRISNDANCLDLIRFVVRWTRLDEYDVARC